MSCSCPKPDTTSLWTPIPEYRQPTDIQPGENIDCYAKRAGSPSGQKNDVAEQIPNRIENTSLTSDLNLNVNVTFKLTPGSDRTPTVWDVTIDGESITTVLPELSDPSSSGVLSGTVSEAHANKLYKVMVQAVDGAGYIDSREFNFFPKKGTKDDTVKFVFPLTGGVITCKFGPRKPPAPGASSMHKGIDCAMTDRSLGNIVAAADGTVVKCGPASGFGNWVVIEHRDAQNRLTATTVYGHMNEIYVNVGQKVSAGQKIAKEGNAGIGSAAHLHFEVHRGAWGNPVDPMPYLNGSFSAANNNLPGQDGEPDPSSYSSVSNSNVGMTTPEATVPDGCPTVVPNQPPKSNPEQDPDVPSTNISRFRSRCAPASTPTSSQVLSAINSALDEAGLTDADDRRFIITVATIESNLDPYAKNPTSSAMGLYQMLDKIATKYFGIIGKEPTCENRCDARLATLAMVEFFRREFKPYYTGYLSSGGTTIAGKSIKDTAWSATYKANTSGLTQGEFLYGLIHHDGVGNAVNGIDREGVAYWRKKVKSA